MRSVSLLLAGVLVGAFVQFAIAQNRTQGLGIVGVNHVGIAVTDLDATIDYYKNTLGLSEAFRVMGDDGKAMLVYLQVSRDTFVELLQANEQRPPGFNHFGIHFDDLRKTVSSLKERGGDVTDVRVSGGSGSVLANLTDPNGIRIELVELPPGSKTRAAMDRYAR